MEPTWTSPNTKMFLVPFVTDIPWVVTRFGRFVLITPSECLLDSPNSEAATRDCSEIRISTLHLSSPPEMLIGNGNGVPESLRELIIGSTVQHPAGPLLLEPTPLLEEERHTSASTPVADRNHPFAVHGPRASSALSANNDPVNTVQNQSPQVLQQRLDREETHGCGRRLQVRDSGQAVLPVLDAHAHQICRAVAANRNRVE